MTNAADTTKTFKHGDKKRIAIQIIEANADKAVPSGQCQIFVGSKTEQSGYSLHRQIADELVARHLNVLVEDVMDFLRRERELRTVRADFPQLLTPPSGPTAPGAAAA